MYSDSLTLRLLKLLFVGVVSGCVLRYYVGGLLRFYVTISPIEVFFFYTLFYSGKFPSVIKTYSMQRIFHMFYCSAHIS